MALKTILGQQGLPPPKTHIEFDFVIAERPRYIPGSGPPLAPVTVMPANDKDGFIAAEVMLDSELRYVVEYEQQRHLRVGVRLPNILNWVSPRALEKWNSEKYDAEVREEEERELPLLKAKEERRKKRLEKLSRAGLPAETKSRKRKRRPFNEAPFRVKRTTTPESGVKKAVGHSRGPASRNQLVGEEVTFTSPRQSQHSQRQPSLSAPGGGLANRTVLDSDSDEDSMATDMTLEYKLQGGQIPRTHIQSSRSNSPPVNSKRNRRSRSTSYPVNTSQEESRSVSPSAPKITPRRRDHNLPSSLLSGKSAVAATSSREALEVYEDLERKNSKESQTIAEKYSYTRKHSQSTSFQGAHIGLAGPSRGIATVATEDEETDEPKEEQEEDQPGKEEPEYEIHQILKDEIRFTKDGKQEMWYLIDWVGNWDNTWEPAENIAHGAIIEYQETKRKTQGRSWGSAPGDGEGNDPDLLFFSERGKGKGEEAMRGEVIDDDDDYDDDDDDDDELQWQAFGLST